MGEENDQPDGHEEQKHRRQPPPFIAPKVAHQLRNDSESIRHNSALLFDQVVSQDQDINSTLHKCGICLLGSIDDGLTF